MAQNDFKPFAIGSGANVTSQADWEALPALISGFQAGKASSAQVNKAIRQASFIAAALAQFVSDKNGADVLDDGDLANFIDLFESAVGIEATGRLINVRTFTSSTSYIPSVGTKTIIVEAIGGGGAGGGAQATSSTQVCVCPGGNAGAYVKSRIETEISQVTITIGAGGIGAVGAIGGSGGDTSFGSLVIAPGGKGGSSYTPASPPVTNMNLNAPSIGSSTEFTIEAGYSGRGQPGLASAFGYGASGDGGLSRFGSGGRSVGLTAASTPGDAAVSKGAGGSGGTSGQGAGASAGGDGAPGVVVVWEYA
ncbi:glycine-rich domain-containing protein [Escherichia coli]|uniref:glycine-rich domain-containing protein n=1 Tax=Escherichia coli TaxID=562 RepID=UPI00210D056A|nr:hypothetical protein [Escherichia coli]